MRKGVVIAAVLTVAVPATSACARQTPARQAADRSGRVADLAATPDQARLWREAAAQDLAVDLQLAPLIDRPVERRVTAITASQQVAPQPIVIPAGVLTAVRILVAPDVAPNGFVGAAVVADLAGDWIELNLGPPQRLTVLARAGGRPLVTQAGYSVRVDYRRRADPRIPRDILAIRTAAGGGIAQAVQGGTGPVTLSVPLFDLVATQTGNPPAMTVVVTVGAAKQTMTVGETAQIGGLTVTLIGSSARTWEDAGRIEGSPYTINLITWR